MINFLSLEMKTIFREMKGTLSSDGLQRLTPNVRVLVYTLKHVCFYLKMEVVGIHCEQRHDVLVEGY